MEFETQSRRIGDLRYSKDHSWFHYFIAIQSVSFWFFFLVPSVSFANIWNQEKTKQMTTYQKDFGKEYRDIISVLHSLDPEEVKEYVEKAPYPGK